MQSSIDQPRAIGGGDPFDLLLFVLEYRVSGGELTRVALVPGEGDLRLCAALIAEIGGSEGGNGVVQRTLSSQAVLRIMKEGAGTTPRSLHSFFQGWKTSGVDSLSCTLLSKQCGDSSHEGYFRTFRSSLLFQLFNEGALRASDVRAREVLADALADLPLRKLDGEGRFMTPVESPEAMSDGPADPSLRSPAGIDRVESLLTHRSDLLLKEGNQIAPGVYVRDAVHIGRKNILLSHTFVDVAVFIGNANFIDSHVSVGSGAQIHDGNMIAPFVCIEGALGTGKAQVASIGSCNSIGSYSQIGAGMKIGDENYIGPGVALNTATKVKDCRARSLTKGDYLSGETVSLFFNRLAIARNSAERLFNGVDVLPGEYVLFDNVPECMSRFEGDGTSKNGH